MRITNIEYLGGYSLKLTFGDGYVGKIDLEPTFSENDPLRDSGAFLKGVCNGLTIEWPGGIDFCPDVLRLWCEKGRVLLQKETDFHLGAAHPIHVAA